MQISRGIRILSFAVIMLLVLYSNRIAWALVTPAAPAAPIILAPANGADLHVGTIPIAGTADAGSTVLVYVDGVLVGTTAPDIAGDWSISANIISGGTHSVSATAFNTTGTSPVSAIINVTLSNTAPTIPVPITPISNLVISSVTSSLSVLASTDADGDTVTYTFELSLSNSFNPILASGTSITAVDGIATWVIPGTLSDHTMYYWRVTAWDGYTYSNYNYGSFFVNTANEPPAVPGISSPAHNSQVASFSPKLGITNATDADIFDVITYDFEIAVDAGFSTVGMKANIIGLAQGSDGTTSWEVPVTLTEDNFYFWRARARDNHGAISDWVNATFMVNTQNSLPTAPAINSPINLAEVNTLTPQLVVINASDSEHDTLTYVFEIDSINTFNSPQIQVSGNIAEGAGITSWTPSPLNDNTVYFWRAKANDGTTDGPWLATGSIFVNTSNDPPTTPTLKNPADKGEVTVLKPALQVNSSTDMDNDAITYEFAVYEDSALTVLKANAVGQGAGWTVDTDLKDNTTYYWRARATDSHNASSNWMSVSSFFVNNNGYNDPPVMNISSPIGSEPVYFGGSVAIQWSASDPDSVAVITLGHDTTGTGCSGSNITSNISENDGSGSFSWNVDALSEGMHYIYSSITDGTTTKCIYAAGPIMRFNKTGDMNGDGIVEVVDAMLAYQIANGLATPTVADLAHGDVAPLNESGKPQPDGKIDMSDVIVILNKAAGLESW